MGFGDLAGLLEDQGLRGMEHRQISAAPGIVAEPITQGGLGVDKALLRFFEIAAGLRRHRSRPSRLSSCMSGVRSRYEPARYGMA